ncbi:50S ribosomal protein L21 [Citrus sinensis]|uniref:50S ribosomal protein L21 n=1 Tax=Citrus sinensis TaxID=2711 RepID=A0ACB8KTW8_CITSI|nr:50S ribosomal protein L21 [Citrus sinensis]
MAAASSCATLALCSSLTSHCKISCQNPNPHPQLSLSKSKLCSFPSPKLYTRPTFSFTRKFSQTEPPPVSEPEVEPEAALEAEAKPTTEVVESAAKEEPKREEIFAVVMIILNKVLLVGTKTTTYIGKPVVTNAAVHAVVEEQGLNPKVIVFKYKKKKNYRRNIGHRQPNTRIRITGITGYQDYPAVTLDSLKSVQ